MTSPAKILANRRNAQRSTGPRTVEGRARSARNAFQHGLSRPLPVDDRLAAQIESLADEYVALTGGPREMARAAAKERFGLLRIQQARVATLNNNRKQKSIGAADDLYDEN